MSPVLRSETLNSEILLCEITLAEASWVASSVAERSAAQPISRALAEQLSGAPAAHWWSDHFDPANQVHLGSASPAHSWTPVTNWSQSELASKPRGGIWTSTLVAGATPAWSLLPESRPSRQWILAQDLGETLRVWELNRSEDWTELCRRFPRHRQTSVTPDWARVAGEIDVVHLTMMGLVSIQSAVLHVDGSRTTMMGWDTESAIWLRIPPGSAWSLRSVA
jgi:hypothetical protein